MKSVDRLGRDAVNVLQIMKTFTELGVNIIRQLPGHSIRQVARLTDKSKTTVQKVKKAW